MMQKGRIGPDQVSQVRGYADQRLRNLTNPLDPSNRRISIIVQYLGSNPDEATIEDGEISKSGKLSSAEPIAESDAPTKTRNDRK